MTVSYFNIQKFCVHDGPGIRTTVFLKGCPLRCLWCHNPEAESSLPEILFDPNKCTSCGRCTADCAARILSDGGELEFDRAKCVSCGACVERCYNSANELCGKTDTVEYVFEQVLRDKAFYETSGGGMTISGGEPSMQAEGSLALIKMASAEGISTYIETCGFGDASFFAEASDLGAAFLFDIKGIDREKHKLNTGVYPDLIHKNLDMLLQKGARVVVRMPLIPGKNDSQSDLLLLRDFLEERKAFTEYAEILPYHEFGRNKNALLGRGEPESILSGKEFAEKWKEILVSSGVQIRISGE